MVSVIKKKRGSFLKKRPWTKGNPNLALLKFPPLQAALETSHACNCSFRRPPTWLHNSLGCPRIVDGVTVSSWPIANRPQYEKRPVKHVPIALHDRACSSLFNSGSAADLTPDDATADAPSLIGIHCISVSPLSWLFVNQQDVFQLIRSCNVSQIPGVAVLGNPGACVALSPTTLRYCFPQHLNRLSHSWIKPTSHIDRSCFRSLLNPERSFNRLSRRSKRSSVVGLNHSSATHRSVLPGLQLFDFSREVPARFSDGIQRIALQLRHLFAHLLMVRQTYCCFPATRVLTSSAGLVCYSSVQRTTRGPSVWTIHCQKELIH